MGEVQEKAPGRHANEVLENEAEGVAARLGAWERQELLPRGETKHLSAPESVGGLVKIGATELQDKSTSHPSCSGPVSLHFSFLKI